jgi:hypothetical protein
MALSGKTFFTPDCGEYPSDVNAAVLEHREEKPQVLLHRKRIKTTRFCAFIV